MDAPLSGIAVSGWKYSRGEWTKAERLLEWLNSEKLADVLAREGYGKDALVTFGGSTVSRCGLTVYARANRDTHTKLDGPFLVDLAFASTGKFILVDDFPSLLQLLRDVAPTLWFKGFH